jgi:hypothetical protein
MKRSLICAGLVAALLMTTYCDTASRAEAQVVAPPGNTNGVTPQQLRRMRMMMRLRRHHRRHRHRPNVAPITPTTSMIPSPLMPNSMLFSAALPGPVPRRHRGHHHRHHHYQWIAQQLMLRQMMMNQTMQARNVQSPLPSTVAAQNSPPNPNKNLTAQRKRQIAAQLRRASF